MESIVSRLSSDSDGAMVMPELVTDIDIDIVQRL